MRDYEIRRGHWKNIDGEKLPQLMSTFFGPVRKEGDLLVASSGALKLVQVQMLDKTMLRIHSETDRSVDMETASKTMRSWNDFLEAATGYNAKQRSKREQERLKGADAPP